MADEHWKDYSGIKDDLLRNGTSYNIWQALLIGENISLKELKINSPGAEMPGPLLKFKPYENYEYPPRDIKKIFYNEGFLNFVLTFMGLYGINSPIPRCYHEQVAVQKRILGTGEVPLQNFMDIFNNRFYWLYYLAWKKYRFYLHINGNNDNKIAERINSFTGIGRTDSSSLNKLSKFFLLKFSGIFALRARSKSGLVLLLCYMFPGHRMKVREFVPQLVELPEIPGLGEKECILGVNVFIGKAAPDYSSRIALEIGPVDFIDYLNFLPGTENSDKLIELLSIYLNDGLEYNFEFIIKSETIIAVAWNDERLRLGTSVWLGTPPAENVKVIIPYEEIMRGKIDQYSN